MSEIPYVSLFGGDVTLYCLLAAAACLLAAAGMTYLWLNFDEFLNIFNVCTHRKGWRAC